MSDAEREGVLKKIASMKRGKSRYLKDLGIPRSTYYHWLKEKGVQVPGKKWSWNTLTESERLNIEKLATDNPELSPRLLGWKITDELKIYTSESSVYRVLKDKGLLAPRPLEGMPAQDEWKKKTTRVDEIWQCDATNLFIVGWGYYKSIPVLDDFSRRVLSCDIFSDETSGSISDAVELAREEALRLGHNLDPKPKLLSDNGSGFKGYVLAEYLHRFGIKHIFGKPYHPQTQGKVERFNRTLKQKTVCLIVYDTPERLRQSVREAVDAYNARPHEALKNVSPNDVYAGRQQIVLDARAEIKRMTMERRRLVNRAKNSGLKRCAI